MITDKTASNPTAKFPIWEEFESGKWQQEVNVRDFIQRNYTPYADDESFLSDATPTTHNLWTEVKLLMK